MLLCFFLSYLGFILSVPTPEFRVLSDSLKANLSFQVSFFTQHCKINVTSTLEQLVRCFQLAELDDEKEEKVWCCSRSYYGKSSE